MEGRMTNSQTVRDSLRQSDKWHFQRTLMIREESDLKC